MQDHGCGANPTAPAPDYITVIQDGETLRSGNATGTINSDGDFTWQDDFSGVNPCPPGYTCINTTTGKFTMADPMLFTGTGQIDISDNSSIPPFHCSITYDVSGDRRSCAVAATSWGDRWAPVLRMLASPSRAVLATSSGDPGPPILRIQSNQSRAAPATSSGDRWAPILRMLTNR